MTIEREQVEWVFGLTGGELSDAPWSVMYQSRSETTGEPWTPAGLVPADEILFSSWRYWYEGAPAYARTEIEAAHGSNLRTMVGCAIYGLPPETIWDTTDGARWRRVEFYGSSGEIECPGANEDDGDVVTAEHLPVAGDGSPLSADRCALCEAKIGERHGMIYIGDGWGEAVYVRETPRVHFAIIDHGCDGEQYFPGCGVAFTEYTDVATGCGNSAREAAEDAADSMAQSLAGDVEIPDALEEEIRGMNAAPSFDVNDPDISPEWHHYVSIRWRVERS